MEQNFAVVITIVFVLAVMGVAFLFPAGGENRRSKGKNNEGS